MMPEHPWLVVWAIRLIVCAIRLIVCAVWLVVCAVWLRAETGGQHLSADKGRVLGQRPGQFLAVGPPEQSDPVRELEPVLFPGLLNQADHLTRQALVAQGRADSGVQRDRLDRLRWPPPSPRAAVA